MQIRLTRFTMFRLFVPCEPIGKFRDRVESSSGEYTWSALVKMQRRPQPGRRARMHPWSTVLLIAARGKQFKDAQYPRENQ